MADNSGPRIWSISFDASALFRLSSNKGTPANAVLSPRSKGALSALIRRTPEVAAALMIFGNRARPIWQCIKLRFINKQAKRSAAWSNGVEG
jgi:hypothetical protein